MIPADEAIEVGHEYVREADDETYRVEMIYGRGRNRHVRLDRPPTGDKWRDVHMRTFRAFYTRKVAQ